MSTHDLAKLHATEDPASFGSERMEDIWRSSKVSLTNFKFYISSSSDTATVALNSILVCHTVQ